MIYLLGFICLGFLGFICLGFLGFICLDFRDLSVRIFGIFCWCL